MLISRASFIAGVAGLTVLFAGVVQTPAQWTQWGGPNRNFMVESEKLADAWPDEGPPKIWRRELGDGYSSILVDDGVLYTMYRTGQDEFTIALDVRTGATIWEHKYPSPTTPGMEEYGAGPHSTPLIIGERLYSVGTNLALQCFEKKTGKVLWMLDLLKEYGGAPPNYGYACSPIAYKHTIILAVGAQSGYEPPLAAFDQATGELVWGNPPVLLLGTHSGGYSSPILITLDGEDQIVSFGGELINAYSPADGKILWVYPCQDGDGAHATTPVWDGRDRIFVSAAYASSARLLKLNRDEGATFPEELWSSRKMRMHHGTAVLIDDIVYGSSGDFGTAFLCAMDINTGQPVWRERGFKKTNLLYADGKLIMLDEDGVLALTSVSNDEFKLLSKCQLTERLSWTVPTLADGVLYARDRKHIMALNLKP